MPTSAIVIAASTSTGGQLIVSAGTLGTWEYGERPATQPGSFNSSATGPITKNTTTTPQPSTA